jgi:hypothetical protein
MARTCDGRSWRPFRFQPPSNKGLVAYGLAAALAESHVHHTAAARAPMTSGPTWPQTSPQLLLGKHVVAQHAAFRCSVHLPHAHMPLAAVALVAKFDVSAAAPVNCNEDGIMVGSGEHLAPGAVVEAHA